MSSLGRLVVFVAACVAVLTSVPVPAATEASRPAGDTSSRPDIVVLMVDDLAEMDVRLWKRLPTIREMFLERGVRFTDYVGNDPLCCPGRAAFLTGQRTEHHGVDRNDARLLDPRVTIATELGDAGYHTIAAGKYLNGIADLDDKLPPGWDHALLFGGSYWGPRTWLDGERRDQPDPVYSTDLVADHAVGWIVEAPSTDPLFVYLTPYAVHEGLDRDGSQPVWNQPSPPDRYRGDVRCATIPRWRPPGYNEADVSDKPNYIRHLKPVRFDLGWPLRRDCETMLAVDDLLRRVRDAMKAEGRTNVLYLLTADNGMSFGAHRWPKKHAPYAVDMPLFMRWKARLGDEPRTIATTATNTDLAPTLCELAGCEMGPYPNGFGADGVSLARLLVGSSDVLGRSFVPVGHPGPYVETPGKGPQVMPSWRGIRSTDEASIGRWAYTEYETGTSELYDLDADPWQLRNRARDPATADVRAVLADALDSFEEP